MKQVQAYQCSHCSMTSLNKHSVKRHEANHCRVNPNRTACSMCEYFSMCEDDGPSCDEGLEPSAHNENIECGSFRLKQ